MSLRILFLCTTCPFGDTSGAGKRTAAIGRILQGLGNVTLVAATEREWTPEQLAQTKERFDLGAYIRYIQSPPRNAKERLQQILDPYFLNSNGVAVSPQDVERVTRFFSDHDMVWIHTLKVANAFRRFRWPHSVMDVDDVPSRYHRLAAAQLPLSFAKFKRWRSAIGAARRESVCHKRFSVLTVCNESDRRLFPNTANVQVIPNGFEPPEPIEAFVADPHLPRLGMIGDFRHLPNADGLRWFLHNVWQHVRQQVPSATLRLIGKSSPEIVAACKAQGVAALGYVNDPAKEIASWSGMIVPTRMGGGTHLKVAEALARRVPIITTPHGARGYLIEHQRHALVAASPTDFAQGCVRLLTEPPLRTALVQAGSQLFNERYSWDSIAPAVEAAVSAALGGVPNRLTITAK